LIGLVIVLFIMEVQQRNLGEDKYGPAPLLRKMVDAGYLGRKSRRGFYQYKRSDLSIQPSANNYQRLICLMHGRQSEN